MTRRTRTTTHQDASDISDTAPKVVIAVLTWNGYAKTRACIESLLGLTGWPVPVVVVDNGSQEREGERLAMECGPPVEALTLPRNPADPGGYTTVADGYNAALRWGADRGATHVLLLNNDTLVTDPGMLVRLKAATAPDVAAVAPVTRNRDGSTYSAGGRFSWVMGLSGHRRAPVETDRPYQALWLDGPCILVSLDAVRRIGGFDPVFASYWEDVDWCMRAVNAGYRCLVEPRTSMIHLRGGTIPSSEAEANDLRNGILFMRRHGGWWSNFTALAFFMLVRSPVHVARRSRSSTRRVAALRAIRRAVTWNARDARRRSSWRIESTGPTIQEMPTPTS